MSQTHTCYFSCPYCMAENDLEVDEENDIGQQQIVDCQVCCSPIEIFLPGSADGWELIARRDDE